MTQKEKEKAKLERELKKQIKNELEKKAQKKEKIWNGVYDVLDSLAMIIAAAGGIILSKYIPEFRAGGDIIFAIPSWGRIIISAVLAVGVIAMTELKGSKAGKRKNFIKRIWFAFANGMAWHTILGF
jgi:hypothetical protein